MTDPNAAYTPERLLVIADALERLESTTWRPNFPKVTFPEKEGGGALEVTYGDLAVLFRSVVQAHARLDALLNPHNEV